MLPVSVRRNPTPNREVVISQVFDGEEQTVILGRDQVPIVIEWLEEAAEVK